jgi:hypothetical protein
LKAAAFLCSTSQGTVLHIGSGFRVASVQIYSGKLPNQQYTSLPLVLIVDYGLHRAHKICAGILVTLILSKLNK